MADIIVPEDTPSIITHFTNPIEVEIETDTHDYMYLVLSNVTPFIEKSTGVYAYRIKLNDPYIPGFEIVYIGIGNRVFKEKDGSEVCFTARAYNWSAALVEQV